MNPAVKPTRVIGDNFIAFITKPRKTTRALRKDARLKLRTATSMLPADAKMNDAKAVAPVAPVAAVAPNSPMRSGVRARLFGNPVANGDNTPPPHPVKRQRDYICIFDRNSAPVKPRTREALANLFGGMTL
jgi:hypothetical protein